MTAKKRILLLVLMGVLSMSCASRMQNGTNSEKAVEAENIYTEIEILVKKGDYTEALERIGTVDPGAASEARYGALYRDALNGIADGGMDYYKAGDYTRAGHAFEYVIGHMPHGGRADDNLRYSPEQIRSLAAACEDKMMQEGLMKYREGNLGEAITIWKELLKINPGHSEAKKALKTATVQLKNLNRIESE